MKNSYNMKNKMLFFLFIFLLNFIVIKGVLAETLIFTIDNRIDYNFTKNYQLEFKNYQLEVNNVKIRSLVSINGIEKDLSKIDYVVVINDARYYYNYSITLRNLQLSNVNYIAFNLTGLKKLDDVSYTDGKLRYFFDDLNAYGNLSMTDSKVILYNPTTLDIDPIIELLGNSTNKFYVSASTAIEKTPSYATTEFTQAEYNKTNRTDNLRYQTSVIPVINGLPKWKYNRFTFNISTIPSIETIKYCIEGYYTTATYSGGQVTYYYNVTSASWVMDIPTSLDDIIESTKCKTFINITEVYNSTSGLFQFGSEILAMEEDVVNIYIDFINVTINYTVATTTTTSSTTTSSTTTTIQPTTIKTLFECERKICYENLKITPKIDRIVECDLEDEYPYFLIFEDTNDLLWEIVCEQ